MKILLTSKIILNIKGAKFGSPFLYPEIEE